MAEEQTSDIGLPSFMQKAFQTVTGSVGTSASESSDRSSTGAKVGINENVEEETASEEQKLGENKNNENGDRTVDQSKSSTPAPQPESPAPLSASSTAEVRKEVQRSANPSPVVPKTFASGSIVTAGEAEQNKTAVDSSAVRDPPQRPSLSRLRMEKELSRMAAADVNARLRAKDKRKKEVAKVVAQLHARKRAEGVTLTPCVEESRAAIRQIVREEEMMALSKEQTVLRKETDRLQAEMDVKYGLKDKKRRPDLAALTHQFYHGNASDDGLPDSVRRELTRAEIKDLKMVFDMFDMKGRGYITANDVKRAAGMLGFKAKTEIFTGMIEEVTGDKRSQVTFIHFLQFLVKGQGEGDDPLEDILQGFRLLDEGQKGYVTAEDLRKAADLQKLPLSNRAIREMIQDADLKGDSKISAEEFVRIMLQTSMFRTAR